MSTVPERRITAVKIKPKTYNVADSNSGILHAEFHVLVLKFCVLLLLPFLDKETRDGYTPKVTVLGNYRARIQRLAKPSVRHRKSQVRRARDSQNNTLGCLLGLKGKTVLLKPPQTSDIGLERNLARTDLQVPP